MTPLPWDKGDNRDNRANTQKLFFEYCFVNLTHFSVKHVQFLMKLLMWPKGSPKGPRRTTKGSPRAPQGSQRDKTEFIKKIFHEKYTMVTHPKGIKSPVHPFENWKTHPEDFFGNVSPTKSLVCPET